jgi:anti-sigma regulatory factor (Ser/Thr protein kinase)
VAVASRDLVEPHDHVVNIYDADEDLVVDVVQFVATGLLAGEAAVVLARPAHRNALAAGLRQHDIDVDAALTSGQYVSLDAADTLASFMTDGMPDRARFMTVIGGVIARATEHGQPLRAFGEMVALLWQDNNVLGAIELESLWSELAGDHQFSLYCAYPMASLSNIGDLSAVREVCDQHSRLVAPVSYRSGTRQSVIEERSGAHSQLFVPAPYAARAVRRFVTDALCVWGESALVREAAVVSSELATNAVVHARCPFRVSVNRSDATVRIEVEDKCAALPQHLEQPQDGNGGRGIALVACLCSSWGTERHSDGKTVWAELARSSHQ